MLKNNIRKYRADAGLTQQKVADLTGVTRTMVAKWEANNHQPQRIKWERIAEVLNVPRHKVYPLDKETLRHLGVDTNMGQDNLFYYVE